MTQSNIMHFLSEFQIRNIICVVADVIKSKDNILNQHCEMYQSLQVAVASSFGGSLWVLQLRSIHSGGGFVVLLLVLTVSHLGTLDGLPFYGITLPLQTALLARMWDDLSPSLSFVADIWSTRNTHVSSTLSVWEHYSIMMQPCSFIRCDSSLLAFTTCPSHVSALRQTSTIFRAHGSVS